MAINNKTLSSIQNQVTGLTTNESDFRTGLDDTLVQVNASEILLSNVDAADLTKLANITASAENVNILAGTPVTSDELNQLEGCTFTSEVINILAQYTGDVTELNKLDGLEASKEEINKLVDWTGTSSDLNKLANVTSSAADLNVLDGFKDTHNGTLADLVRCIALDAAGNGTAGQVLTSDGLGAYSWTSPDSFTFVVEDEDGTEISVDTDELKFIGDGMTINWGDGNGTDGNPYILQFDNSDKGSSQYIFKNIAVSGQTTIAADKNDDTLTVAAGTGITVTTNSDTDTLTVGLDLTGSVAGEVLKRTTTGIEWVADNNTTYSAGSGLDLASGVFSVEPDLRDGITHIGLDSTDYINFVNNSYHAHVVNGTERFRVDTAGADVTGALTVSGNTVLNTLDVSGTASLGNWDFTQDSTALIIKYNGTSLFKLTSGGNLTVIGNVTAYGTI